ncbi:MAG: hypothetical protein U9N12_00895 [Euryarchaeota archaeon]|nr:hypothetical protein [Euryarchaeota archaeon]
MNAADMIPAPGAPQVKHSLPGCRAGSSAGMRAEVMWASVLRDLLGRVDTWVVSVLWQGYFVTVTWPMIP